MSEQQLPWRFAIVVGASSGLGASIARHLTDTGATVALVARRADLLQILAEEINQGRGWAYVYPHDVTKTEEVPGLFQRITTDLGGLDLIVYSAGIMPPVGASEFPTEVDKETISVNFTGAVAWLNEAALRFSRAKAGTIVAISSVAGDRGRVGNPVYNATKAGLNTYMEALRNRLARDGVRVLVAKPGYIKTPLIENVTTPRFIPVASADDVADGVLRAAAAGKREVYLPSWWAVVMLVTRLVPAPIFERLKL